MPRKGQKLSENAKAILTMKRLGCNNPMFGKYGQKAGNWKGGKIKVNCQKCNKEFFIFPYKMKSGRGKYCSRKCQLSARGSKSSTKFKIGNEAPRTCYKKGDIRIIGENNNNWSGGTTPELMKIRSSDDYKEWRKKIFERDNYTCQLCGDSKGHNLEADHIQPFWKFVDKRFDVSNGRTLCNKCHSKYGYNYFRDLHSIKNFLNFQLINSILINI